MGTPQEQQEQGLQERWQALSPAERGIFEDLARGAMGMHTCMLVKLWQKPHPRSMSGVCHQRVAMAVHSVSAACPLLSEWMYSPACSPRQSLCYFLENYSMPMGGVAIACTAWFRTLTEGICRPAEEARRFLEEATHFETLNPGWFQRRHERPPPKHAPAAARKPPRPGDARAAAPKKRQPPAPAMTPWDAFLQVMAIHACTSGQGSMYSSHPGTRRPRRDAVLPCCCCRTCPHVRSHAERSRRSVQDIVEKMRKREPQALAEMTQDELLVRAEVAC